MTKKQNPKLKNPKAKDAIFKNPDFKDILAIAEGHNWKPVTRKGRFVDANCSPGNMSQAELRRFWGEPRDKDRNLLDSAKECTNKKR
jgi:hypothetical protein